MKVIKHGDKVKAILNVGMIKRGEIFEVTDVWSDRIEVNNTYTLLDGEYSLVEPENSGQSARYNSGKVQLREIDPDFITGLGEVLTASRTKYDEGNWMKETKFSTPYESCMRHLMKFWNGEELDEETGKHHLLHAATNLMFLYYHQDSGKGIDDRLFKKVSESKKR